MSTAVPVTLSGPSGATIYGGLFAPAVVSGGLALGDVSAGGSIAPAGLSSLSGAVSLDSVGVSGGIVGSGGSVVSSAYRAGQANLFADVPASVATEFRSYSYGVSPPPELAPVISFDLGPRGPNYYNVEVDGGWAWGNQGGDWIDTAGTAQGTLAHCSFSANSVTSGSASYTADITAGVQAAYTRGKWNGYILRLSGGGARSIATHHHATLAAPSISVTYSDSTTATLACRACCGFSYGNNMSNVGAPEAALASNGAIEFDMPTKPVASATLNVVVSKHDATATSIKAFLVNPQTNTNIVQLGVAAAYPTDSGLAADSSILFAQRYSDGTTLADFVDSNFVNLNFFQYSNWDPELFGGASDTTKLPTALSGKPVAGTHKWIHKIATTGTISKVDSTYAGDGFAPPEPGIGALRVVTPKSSDASGSSEGYSGKLGADLWALFPKAISGNLDEVFVRFRVRFHNPLKPLSSTKYFRNDPGLNASPAIRQGKFGIGAHHWTDFGGNNNIGGTNLGWSNRLGGHVNPSDLGPACFTPLIHSYDNIGYNLSFANDAGLGITLYNDVWYWVEIRLKLNTYNSAGAIGSSPSDGVCQVWIDGRLAATNTGFKYRDGAIDYVSRTNPAAGGPTGGLPPFRQMGAMGILLNQFNGGTLPADEDTIIFYSQIAVGTSYVGPSPSNLPSWVPSTPGDAVRHAVGGGVLTNNFRDVVAPWMGAFYDVGVVNDYSGPVGMQGLGSHGSVLFYGGGHSATNSNQVTALKSSASQLSFVRLSNPTAWSGSKATDSGTQAANSYTTDITSLVDSQWLDAVPGISPGEQAPTGVHSYSALVSVPGPGSKGNMLNPFVAAAGTVNANTAHGTLGGSHRFSVNSDTDPSANSWARVGSLPGFSTYGWQGPLMSCYVAAQNRVYYMPGAGGKVRWLDLATGAHVEGSASGFVTSSDYNTGQMFYVPGRELMLFVYRGSDSKVGVQWMDVSVSSPTLGGYASLSTALNLDPFGVGKSSAWVASFWCQDNQRLVCGGVQVGGVFDNAMYEIEIPVSLASAWNVTRRPIGGSAAIDWGVWTFQQPVYLPAAKAAVLFQRANRASDGADSVIVYRPYGT